MALSRQEVSDALRDAYPKDMRTEIRKEYKEAAQQGKLKESMKACHKGDNISVSCMKKEGESIGKVFEALWV